MHLISLQNRNVVKAKLKRIQTKSNKIKYNWDTAFVKCNYLVVYWHTEVNSLDSNEYIN